MSKYLELYYTFNAFKYNAVLVLICIIMYVLYSYTLHKKQPSSLKLKEIKDASILLIKSPYKMYMGLENYMNKWV